MSKEHDEREVEALALVLYNAAWPMNQPILDWDTSTASKAAWEHTAAFVLDREAALVAALEKICMAYKDCVADGIASDALAAHRLATKPPEPTLEQVVERVLLCDGGQRGPAWAVMMDSSVFDDLRAALKRAQASDTTEGRARERAAGAKP